MLAFIHRTYVNGGSGSQGGPEEERSKGRVGAGGGGGGGVVDVSDLGKVKKA